MIKTNCFKTATPAKRKVRAATFADITSYYLRGVQTFRAAAASGMAGSGLYHDAIFRDTLSSHLSSSSPLSQE